MSPEDAEALVRFYMTELDSVIYGLAGLHSTVNAVREASPTLLAVICTVAALHDVDHAHLYDVCYREFRHLVSTALFEKRDIEHVRALDVAAFWLPDTSRVVLYEAVRRLGDLRVHRHISKACTPPDDAFAVATQHPTRDGARDRVRLWYTLYMCDQHLSVLYNRDSLIRRDRDILDKRALFLSAPDATMHDLRIVAQVTLLLCMSRMKETFGSEYPTRVPEALAPQIPVFVDELEQWLAHFPPQFRECCCIHPSLLLYDLVSFPDTDRPPLQAKNPARASSPSTPSSYITSSPGCTSATTSSADCTRASSPKYSSPRRPWRRRPRSPSSP